MGKTYIRFQKEFNAIVRNQVEVVGVKYDTEVREIITDAEKYRQCYKLGSKVREQLPKYWFVSKEGFLVSVNGQKAKWIKPNLTSGRPQFKVSYHGKLYPITTYDLVGLVWDSYVSPDAEKALDKYGLKVIGRSIKPRRKGKKDKNSTLQHVLKVQGHHKGNSYIHKNDLESYVANNNPEQLQFITNREHITLHALSGSWNEDKGKFFREDMVNVPDESPKVYMPEEVAMMPVENFRPVKVLEGHLEYLESDCFKTKEYTFVSEGNRDLLEKYIDVLVDAAKSCKNISSDIRFNQIDLLGTIVFFEKNN